MNHQLAGKAGGSARPARLPATVSWLGNSYGGAKRWVQQNVKNILVTPDGTVYAVVEWDEAGREVGVYKDGEAVAMAGHSHGWGYHGGTSVAVNNKYVFFAQSVENEGGGLKDPQTWPPKGKQWFGVSRRLRSDITQGAPFPGGKGGSGATLRGAFLLVNEVDEKTDAPVRGMWATEDRLYLSDPANRRVRIYDAETMTQIGGWAMERPNQMAMDRTGALWILQKGDASEPPRIVCYSPGGVRQKQQILLPKNADPTALCLDGQGRLLVADNGPDQNVKIYAGIPTAPGLAGTFGKKGGIYAERLGAFGPLKFNTPMGAGSDRKGNFYVASDGSSGGGGTVLESYAPSGKLNWRLFGLLFVDMADVDPASDVDVYTKEERFRLDYAARPGAGWRYAGYTIHRFKYPEDPRLHIWSAGAWVRRIRDKPFLFVGDMNAEYLQVYRFDPRREGEIAVPSGLFSRRRIGDKTGWPPHQPERGEWIWRDKNGNGAFDAGEYVDNGGRDAPPAQGWWVDDAGTVWLATETEGIRKFPLQGLDETGNPVWDYRSLRTFPKPAEFDRVKRLRYDPRTDVMVLGGTTPEHTNQHWKPMGPVICRYDNWSRSERKPRWQIVAPYEKGSSGHESCEPMGFDVAGDYLFVPYTGASKAINFRTGHIEVFRVADGSPVGHMEPSPEIGEIGLQDIRECLRAHRRSDGAYVVFLEEDWKAKVLMYRWTPRHSASRARTQSESQRSKVEVQR